MSQTPVIANKPLKGIALKVASVVVFTAMATCIKAASHAVPPGEAVFFRSFFAIPVILVWLIWQQDLKDGLKTRNLKGHMWRGFLGTCAMILGFTSLAYLPLPEATAIGFAAPIITMVLAAIFLGETIRIYRLGAVLVGLMGVLIILSPRLGLETSDLATIGAIAALGSAFLRAAALIFTRKLVVKENTATIVFYFSSIAAVLGLFTIPFGWTIPPLKETIILICSGLFGGVAQILLTNSYRYAAAGTIAPFDYTAMILSLIVGFFLFDEIPTLIVLAGAALIIAAGIFIIFRERNLGLKRGAARSVTPNQG